MGDQAGETPSAPAKPRPTPPSRKGKGPTPTSWRAGTSGNPRGRPRAGQAFAERVRERVDPDTVIDIALRLAADPSVPDERKLAALLPLIDRGFIKPPAGHELTVTAGATATSRDIAALPLEERRELLARIRRVPELAASHDQRSDEPLVSVEDQP